MLALTECRSRVGPRGIPPIGAQILPQINTFAPKHPESLIEPLISLSTKTGPDPGEQADLSMKLPVCCLVPPLCFLRPVPVFHWHSDISNVSLMTWCSKCPVSV